MKRWLFGLFLCCLIVAGPLSAVLVHLHHDAHAQAPCPDGRCLPPSFAIPSDSSRFVVTPAFRVESKWVLLARDTKTGKEFLICGDHLRIEPIGTKDGDK